MESIDIRYLDIVWNTDRSVLKVEESDQPIELDRVDHHWHADTVTYPQKFFYIGICITDELLYEPYLKLPNNESSSLMPIKVPGEDKTWWVQKGDWDKRYKKYLSAIYRTAGRIEISAQNEVIILENHTVNFSVADLEYYLSDLKDRLWMLMLDSKSASKVSIQKETPSIFSLDVLRLFGELASSFEAVIKKPHVTLFEIQEKLPKRLVKPVPKTFREIATQSTPKLLTSRSFKESYDTPENRYIHYLSSRALYLLKALGRLATYQLSAMRKKAELDEQWLREESGRKTKLVDPVIIDSEIQAITFELKKQRKMLLESIQQMPTSDEKEDFSDQVYLVELGNRYGKSEKSFFVTLLEGVHFKEKYKTYLVFLSSIDFKEIFRTEYLGGYEFRITGSGRKSKKTNNKGNTYYELCFTHIDSIDIVRSPLEQELTRLKVSKKELENNAWVAKLNRDELEGIYNQEQIARKRLNLVEVALEQLGEFNSHIPSLISRIKKSVQFFQTQKVKQQQECPNSMVFIQNPLYATAKHIYRKVSNLEGMNDSILNSMMAIDEIGLVNLPDLYERWCLLQLIVVISDIYHFQIENGWQQKVIDAVLKNRKNVEIDFSCERRQLNLKLTYEKDLDSGKRPDYVIDLYYYTYSSNSESNFLEENPSDSIQWIIEEQKMQRMVLDAKFRGDVGEQHINNLIEELYKGKNYSEDGKNSVFVIHPVAEVIVAKTSPLKWGGYCNYGQANQIDHRKGAVYLSPSRDHSNSIENLQRLIGMLLQNHTSILDDGVRTKVMWHNKSCISCGGHNLSISFRVTNGGSIVNKIHCNYCGQNSTETNCVSCHKPIYKNGMNWTYHRTRAEQTSNIVCPACETFLKQLI